MGVVVLIALDFPPLLSGDSIGRPKLSRISRIMLSRGVFLRQLRRPVVTPFPKGPLSSLVFGYRPISLTPNLSKIYERLISTRLCCFMERSGLFPSHTVCSDQRELDGGRKLTLVQLDFSTAFDRVGHRGLLFKLEDAGIGGPILTVQSDFLSEWTQIVKLDGVRSSMVNVVSGVPQGSVLCPLLFLLYITDLPPLLENALVGYADDSTLVANVSSPCVRPTITASLNRDLVHIDEWCARWGTLINSAKTYGMMILRSRTARPTFPVLFCWW